jgi:hypothetical protein
MLLRLNLLLALAGGSLFATSFTFSDFSSPSNLNLVGNASLTSNLLRLTPALDNQNGAAWYNSLVNVQAGFTTNFTFRISDRGGFKPDWEPGVENDGADGFAFVVQAQGINELGLFASGIGYYNIVNSLAVEFDTWANKPSYCEPNGNHIAVQSLGTLMNRPEHCAGTEFDGTFTNPNLAITTVADDLSNGNAYNARIVYAPGLLQVFLTDMSTPILAANVNLADLLNLQNGQNAYIGFTSSTGGAWENHDIISWSYAEVPEPATWALIGAGLIAGGLLRRRRG